MGQKIYYILTKSNIDVPFEIVHFKEKNGLIFPLLMDEYLFKDITADANRKDVSTIEDFYFNVLRFHSFEYPTKKVFRFIKQRFQSFALVGYREILEIPDNLGDIILFLNNSKVDTRNKRESDVHKILDVEISFFEVIQNERKYWSFSSAENTYFEELKKKVANTM